MNDPGDMAMNELPRIQHVSIPRPPGEEARTQARAFYGQLLRLTEVQAPSSLRERDLIWYRLGNSELHIFVETWTQGSPGRHFCIEVEDVASVQATVTAAGYTTEDATPITGRPRFFVRDPFGNLVEFTTIEANYLDEEDGEA
jgi:catechol 2,3-dioxygenase-like lactoylglutathione lyase family enzyme